MKPTTTSTPLIRKSSQPLKLVVEKIYSPSIMSQVKPSLYEVTIFRLNVCINFYSVRNVDMLIDHNKIKVVTILAAWCMGGSKELVCQYLVYGTLWRWILTRCECNHVLSLSGMITNAAIILSIPNNLFFIQLKVVLSNRSV